VARCGYGSRPHRLPRSHLDSSAVRRCDCGPSDGASLVVRRTMGASVMELSQCCSAPRASTKAGAASSSSFAAASSRQRPEVEREVGGRRPLPCPSRQPPNHCSPPSHPLLPSLLFSLPGPSPQIRQLLEHRVATRVRLTVGNRPVYRGNRPGLVTVPAGYQPLGLGNFEFEFQKLKIVEKIPKNTL
jgi:hypothetical protein